MMEFACCSFCDFNGFPFALSNQDAEIHKIPPLLPYRSPLPLTSGVRPYKCNSCDKSFTQRCSLESHTLKVHNIQHDYAYKERRAKMYVCEECGNTTNQPDYHFNHLKTQHPYSLALSKFNDKRHFKFGDKDSNSVLMHLQNQNSNSSTITNNSSSSSVEKMEK